jgi:hypothetical protein
LQVGSVALVRVARCCRWCTRSRRAAPTSIMPTCCARGRRNACWGSGVMAPSTLGTFLRAFTFGHIRQLEKVGGETIRRAWSAGAGPVGPMTMDLDSTIWEVHGKGEARRRVRLVSGARTVSSRSSSPG